MRLIPLLFFIFIVMDVSAQDGAFMTDQKRYPRVRIALSEKSEIIDGMLAGAGVEKGKLNIIIVAFKAEKRLELYVCNGGSYGLLTTYDICATSGRLGPKRKQGDRQIPEGFYKIVRFNPSSNYHLSMGIDYPNASDKLKSNAANLGGDIFIHGSCVTIGCLPMTNDKIKEIYLLAAYARDNGQTDIPVYIFPFRMDAAKFAAYEKRYQKDTELIGFWRNIKTGYDLFTANPQVLKYTVNNRGDYIFDNR